MLALRVEKDHPREPDELVAKLTSAAATGNRRDCARAGAREFLDEHKSSLRRHNVNEKGERNDGTESWADEWPVVSKFVLIAY